ncbi:hypothetical protein WUBG_14513 [Wuchereria bancrofti]|uniref:Uncharacterized protein n=1 Tax=Wuchereria bancrofti TaxID=6293 RepID=J9EC45_WUCBA|nr:hypothetical protein WUBG_14513 [Wuchereria bancrofti]VDM20899.1 unnamed protein product [Wuchereria bancrofti]
MISRRRGGRQNTCTANYTLLLKNPMSNTSVEPKWISGWPLIRFHILKGGNDQASVGSGIRSVALSFFEGQALFFCGNLSSYSLSLSLFHVVPYKNSAFNNSKQ